ncbi:MULTISPECIES: hypothetical protein [unclassified Sphingomonas]|uniref:hypothetical protein n=1 Tax=unclassified Sphingomonas TaxID=196159 RepID=UPI0021510A41|nr:MULTISPECIES: hypothetical protein [unclassified Sphingomonas]MCR5872280.1 hypothetical protein [Sphingomonas sp. J344]UUX99420.1 hypothetical protein LRS08_18575 [Sphingomonas sp. J315]
MQTTTNDGVASAVLTFDPAQWLSDFATLGGGYVHTGERIAFLTAGVFAQDLTFMMAQLVGRPERMNAVKAEIAARAGEVFA